MQTTSPIPPQRQTIMALFRCRAHWKTSHTVKGTHSRARCLNRKNRRHHGLSAECTGPGNIETTAFRKPVTMPCGADAYDFQYASSVPSIWTIFLSSVRHSKMNFNTPGCIRLQSLDAQPESDSIVCASAVDERALDGLAPVSVSEFGLMRNESTPPA